MINAIIQARMSSKRYPGKVLYSIGGKSLLRYLIERVRLVLNINQIIIATSIQTDDDAIEDFCQINKIKCFRGSLHNVAGRFLSVLNNFSCDAFIRINADSPLLSHELINQGILLFNKNKADLVTNVLPRSYPKGQSVEIINTETFIKSFNKMQSSDELEHVTRYFYKNANKYKIANFKYETDLSHIQLSVDTREDMMVFEKIIKRMDKPHWEYSFDDLLQIYRDIKKNEN